MVKLFLLAQSALASESGLSVTPETLESVFGGVVLALVLALIFAGKLRLEREVKDKEELIQLQEQTMAQQRETIDRITKQDKETLKILRDLRDVAVRRGEIRKD